MVDRAASPQPAGALKQQVPLVPCKGRGRFPAHNKKRSACLWVTQGPSLVKAMTMADYWICAMWAMWDHLATAAAPHCACRGATGDYR